MSRRRPRRGSRDLVFPPFPLAETQLRLEKVARAPGTGTPTLPQGTEGHTRPQGVPSSLGRDGAWSPPCLERPPTERPNHQGAPLPARAQHRHHR